MRSLIYILLAMWIGLTASCGKKEVKPEYTNPKDTFNQAVKLIEKKKYEDARKLLIEIENRDTSKTYAYQAQLKIAESYAKDDEFELAIEEYRKFIKLYPDNKYAPYAQFQIASTYFKQIEGPARGFGYAADALKEFKKLNEMFPRNPYREVIELRIQKCNNVLAAHEFYVGNFYFQKKSYKAALERFKKLIDTFPGYDDIAEVYLLMAESYKGLNKPDDAKEYYQKTLDSSPGAKVAKQAEKGLSTLKH